MKIVYNEDKKEIVFSEELSVVSFDDVETVEEIVTGAVSGLVGCCVDVL